MNWKKEVLIGVIVGLIMLPFLWLILDSVNSLPVRSNTPAIINTSSDKTSEKLDKIEKDVEKIKSKVNAW